MDPFSVEGDLLPKRRPLSPVVGFCRTLSARCRDYCRSKEARDSFALIEMGCLLWALLAMFSVLLVTLW